ncbi:uncharacterized protein TrAtP1_009441 [Trichoderma atroviride]|uniref:uncharacterized protein n=1 Tax=Hypocrea atroviridis TaxID=63577 RepID=UPI00331F8ED2|nr:hypothetical protein TrAtP1_009441 [Trichoderma atroviride]
MIPLRVSSPSTALSKARVIHVATSIKSPIDLRRPKLIGSFEKGRGGKKKLFGNDEVRQRCGFVAQIGPRSVDVFVLWTIKNLESQSWFLEIDQTFARKYERMLDQLC